MLYKETVNQAVARIAEEELGIVVTPKKLLGYIEFPSEEKERGFGYTISLAMLCGTGANQFTVNEQASEAKSFNILPANTITEHRIFLASHWEEITGNRF